MRDVLIIDTETRKIEMIAGSNMSEKAADKRFETAMMRTEIGPYCVVITDHSPDRKRDDILPRDVKQY